MVLLPLLVPVPVLLYIAIAVAVIDTAVVVVVVVAIITTVQPDAFPSSSCLGGPGRTPEYHRKVGGSYRKSFTVEVKIGFTLQKTNSSSLKIGWGLPFCSKETRIPTLHFQVRAVSFREGKAI